MGVNIFYSDYYLDCGPKAKAYCEYSFGLLKSFGLEGSIYEESLKNPPPMVCSSYAQGIRDGEYWAKELSSFPEWQSLQWRVLFAFSQTSIWVTAPWFTISEEDKRNLSEKWESTINSSIKRQEDLKYYQENPEALNEILKGIIKNGD